MYELMGLNPWLYSLGAFLMRRVNSLGFLWILRTSGLKNGRWLELKEAVVYDEEATQISTADHCWVSHEE
jgi:hypothetical protein